VELRRFAERVLFGTTLQDKLLHPDALTDDEPGPPIAPPTAPGRPPSLPLRSPERPPFPSSDRLAEPDAAATALHAFANHELLATELMALALLRFPDADPAYRADLARTLREEQTHLQLYLDRLDELGRPFGTYPLSAFFWDVLAPADSPKAFCAAMGLTLEQANLDFAGHFADAFDRAGDAASAAILRRVLAEEVAHVARGLRWFDRLRGDGDRWEAWVAALPEPLTPRRARGPDFAAAPRLRAGLDPEFVQRVRTFGASRGRPPDVHWLNVPDEARDGPRARGWIQDLEATAILRASHDDLVLLHRPPGAPWLARLAEAGFALPAIGLLRDGAPIGPPDGPVRSLRPWAPTAAAADALSAWGTLDPSPPPDKVADGQLLATLLETLGPADRLLTSDALPCVAADLGAVEAAVARIRSAGHPRVVFKRPLGTAGEGQLRFFEDEILDRQRRWLLASLAEGPLRVEPWLDRVLDLSFQLDASGLRGIVRFHAEGNGRFRGAALEGPTTGLPPEIARFWAADGHEPRWIDAVGRRLADALQPTGPVGIDAFVYRSAGGLRLHPFVERNPRVTFGRLALDLRGRLAPGCVGVWTLLGPAELRRAKAASLAELARRLDAALPLERRGAQLRRCALPTADPEGAAFVLPMLLVAPTAPALTAAMGGVGLTWPPPSNRARA